MDTRCCLPQHFIYFVDEFKMIEQKELEPLKELIDKFSERRWLQQTECGTQPYVCLCVQWPRLQAANSALFVCFCTLPSSSARFVEIALSVWAIPNSRTSKCACLGYVHGVASNKLNLMYSIKASLWQTTHPTHTPCCHHPPPLAPDVALPGPFSLHGGARRCPRCARAQRSGGGPRGAACASLPRARGGSL